MGKAKKDSVSHCSGPDSEGHLTNPAAKLIPNRLRIAASLPWQLPDSLQSRSLPANTNLPGLRSLAASDLCWKGAFDWAPQAANSVRLPVSLARVEFRNPCDWTRVRRRTFPAADRTLCFAPCALRSPRLAPHPGAVSATA